MAAPIPLGGGVGVLEGGGPLLRLMRQQCSPYVELATEVTW